MIKPIMKSVLIVFSLASFVVLGSLLTVHTFTYWPLAIFDLSETILMLFATILFIYMVFNRNKLEKLDNKRRRGIYIGVIIFPLLTIFFIFNGKPYILDIPNAISKKYVTLKNAEI